LRLSPATSPSARYGPGMAFDGAADNIVLFGGSTGTTDFNDTWTWDGTTWTQQFPPVSPPARDQMSFAYDAATRKVVLFGGGNTAANSFLGDTWTWDGIAKTWTQQNPAASPSARRAPMAYDAATKTVVLFGGSICQRHH
jgi:Galactose oxidase, central domain